MVVDLGFRRTHLGWFQLKAQLDSCGQITPTDPLGVPLDRATITTKMTVAVYLVGFQFNSMEHNLGGLVNLSPWRQDR